MTDIQLYTKLSDLPQNLKKKVSDYIDMLKDKQATSTSVKRKAGLAKGIINIKSDFDERGRVYFPGVDFRSFSLGDKLQIESDIKKDFDDALLGITQLPQGVRFGVYLAYKYYTKLFQKIKSASPTKVKEERIRVKDSRKVVLIFSSAFRLRFNLF